MIELIAIAVLSILVLITVPLYKDCDEKATKQVCDTNCLQLERMYHIYLITENKEDTAYEFKYEENICPVNGDIVYIHGSVRCLLHSTATDGKTYQVNYYNLDVIISIGYRIKQDVVKQ